MKVGGGYIWGEVYAKTEENGHIAVGGDDRTVGSIGGYMQGGGHSPSSRYFGLGTDQVLEYTVVLASAKWLQTTNANTRISSRLFVAEAVVPTGLSRRPQSEPTQPSPCMRTHYALAVLSGIGKSILVIKWNI